MHLGVAEDGRAAAASLMLGLPLIYACGGARTFGYLAGAGGLSIVLIYLAVNVAAIRDQFRLCRHLVIPAAGSLRQAGQGFHAACTRWR